MKTYERFAFAWVIGYFVALFPLMYATDGSLFFGFLNGVIGLLNAVAILWFGKKWEECNGKA